MNKHFNISTIKEALTKEDILSANFGLEREGVRTNNNGTLSLIKHPTAFGDKIKNPVITTDFSESQIEMVTPTFKSTDEAYAFLSFLTDIVNQTIPDNEYLWNQSLPCILPDSRDIPIAIYGSDEKSETSFRYRVGLAHKYGTKKQLISGIHYNFSFDEETIKKLYEYDNLNLTYIEFKNQIYLRIVRNYLRYKWLIIYLTGCSVSAHESFTCECKKLMNHKKDDEYYSTNGVSFRNASCGYKNLYDLYPRYDTVENFVSDVQSYINDEILSEAKELYTQIRLKSKDPTNFLESLTKDGILYVELRTVDINTFDSYGISKQDMDFLHLLMIYLLIKEESDYPKWQEESLINEEETAQNGYGSDMTLLKDGCEVTLLSWAKETIDEIIHLNEELNLGFGEVLDVITERINNPDKTYSKRLLEIVKKEGFINSQKRIANDIKQQSLQISIKDKYPQFYDEYIKSALPRG